MILIQTRYKTDNNEKQAIIQAFKTESYYFKYFQYKIFFFINQKNLCLFKNENNSYEK